MDEPTITLGVSSRKHFHSRPDPSAIRARYSDRDRLWDDDWVALVLDTFDDARRSFDFFVNPLGIQADMIETTSGNGGPQWDAICRELDCQPSDILEYLPEYV